MHKVLMGHAATVNAAIRKAQEEGKAVTAPAYYGSGTFTGVYRVRNRNGIMEVKVCDERGYSEDWLRVHYVVVGE